jgi:peptidase inhibitor family I36
MKRAVTCISCIAILLLADAAAVDAAPNSASSQRHCIQKASTTGSLNEHVQCFKTFDAAISAATGGRVNLRSASSGRLVSPTELGGAGPLTQVILSIDYHDANFSGSTFTWYASTGCGFYQTSSMPSGWNDVVSSVDVFSSCAETLYHDSNFGGSTFRIGVNGSAASLGSFNDQTSSEKWCPVYPCS